MGFLDKLLGRNKDEQAAPQEHQEPERPAGSETERMEDMPSDAGTDTTHAEHEH